MKPRTSLTLFWIICTCTVGTHAEMAQAQSCLARLEAAANGLSRGELDACVERIRAETERGDARVCARLLGIVTNEEIHTAVRIEVLKLLCEEAGAKSARDIIDIGRAWASDLDISRHAGEELVSNSAAAAKSYLLATLVTHGVRPLQKVAADPQGLLDLLVAVATRSWVSLQARGESIKLIAESPAPIEQRRAAAEAIVAARPNTTGHARAILKLLDRSSFSKLRALVRQSDDPHSFHYGAASALADLGDLEILTALKRLEPRFTQADRNLGGRLQYCIWQIEIQHPPQRLLDYIASTDENPMILVERRMWAVRRAVDTGVSKDEVREAILRYARNIGPDAPGIRPGLESLKHLGLKLQVLRPDDLADVKVPKAMPVP